MRPSESDFAGPSGKNESWLVEGDDEIIHEATSGREGFRE